MRLAQGRFAPVSLLPPLRQGNDNLTEIDPGAAGARTICHGRRRPTGESGCGAAGQPNPEPSASWRVAYSGIAGDIDI
jgi:hypothetical protein